MLEQEKQLQQTLEELNKEIEQVQQPELDLQALEDKKIDIIDERCLYWSFGATSNARRFRFADYLGAVEFCSLLQYQDELNLDVAKKTYLHILSDDWDGSGQYIPFLFQIGSDKYFGTINGLRLGTTKEFPVIAFVMYNDVC